MVLLVTRWPESKNAPAQFRLKILVMTLVGTLPALSARSKIVALQFDQIADLFF